jgi:pimeloyl-ACP methyl ester carboxylesterase
MQFFGPDGVKMFGCTHVPRGEPTAGVVICCPLEAESRKSYRKEVLLARELSANELVVQRFHYRGSGNSFGESGDATFQTMRDDALAAVAWMKEQTGVKSVAFVGTRWGALVASAAAADFESAPLVLWEPVVSGSRYFREILRSRLMQDLKEGHAHRRSGQVLVDEILREGFVDILGYPIHRSLYESSVDRGLREELGGDPRSVLIVQISPNLELVAEYADLAGEWRAAGFRVESHVIDEEVAWWFGNVRWHQDESRIETRKLLQVTTDWLVHQLSTGGIS